MSHAHKSLCFSFLYKVLEQVPHFGQPEEKNLRTGAAKDIEFFFLPVRGSMINLKQSPAVAHISTEGTCGGKSQQDTTMKESKVSSWRASGQLKGEHVSADSALIFCQLSVLRGKESADATFLLLQLEKRWWDYLVKANKSLQGWVKGKTMVLKR